MAHAAEPHGQFAQAGKLKIHFHKFGTGYPLICIHGAGPGATAWSNFSTNVGELSKHFCAILMDMPHYGKSDKPIINEGGRLSFLAKTIRDFMDTLGIKKAHFLGNSMGGQAALKLAIDYPDKANRIAVIGSSPIKAGSIFQPMPLEGIRAIRSFYRGNGPTPAKMRQVLESLVYNTALITDELVQERFEAATDPEAIEVFTKGIPDTEDLYFELLNVKSKTLLLWGQDDKAGALDVALLMLRRLQDARLYLFPKCGHWVNVEYPEEFNRAVVHFFDEV
jgi:2-hydroxy-6-oxonona-2,4-dienedioate hydrolase/4,5:9,10-diseco-3-hydroxy-5,9,17-trioxoandrosta-1(10),2-diene-4-oate hydrolase